MKETKRCPYCGEEIQLSAKKCKHCGEWLEEKEESSNGLTKEEIDEIVKEAHEELEKESKIGKIIAYVAVAVIVAVVLYFTTPTEEKHRAKACEYADEYSSMLIKELKTIAAENKPALYSVSDFIPDELCSLIKKEVRKSVLDGFKYTNCLLYTVADIEGSTTQIGAVGYIFDFTPIDENDISDDARGIWNDIVEEYNESPLEFLLSNLAEKLGYKENEEDDYSYDENESLSSSKERINETSLNKNASRNIVIPNPGVLTGALSDSNKEYKIELYFKIDEQRDEDGEHSATGWYRYLSQVDNESNRIKLIGSASEPGGTAPYNVIWMINLNTENEDEEFEIEYNEKTIDAVGSWYKYKTPEDFSGGNHSKELSISLSKK